MRCPSIYPPRQEHTEPLLAGQVWSDWLRPLVFMGVGAAFMAQAVAFAYQLAKGESMIEE